MAGEKQTMVGRFFEEVAHSILGGELTRNSQGDICLWEEETTIEVKASGDTSSYGFRLDLNQIDSYSERSRLPFRRAWYVLFAYRNDRKNKKGGRPTELSFCSTSVAVNRYLARATHWCVVVDLSIVEAWKRTRPVSEKSIMGHLGTKTVDIRCSEVRRFMDAQAEIELRKIGLDPAGLSNISGVIDVGVKADLLQRHRVRLPLTLLVRKEDAEWVAKKLQARGLKPKPDP